MQVHGNANSIVPNQRLRYLEEEIKSARLEGMIHQEFA